MTTFAVEIATKTPPPATVSSEQMYRAMPPWLRATVQEAAASADVPLYTLSDKAADVTVAQRGELVLEWPIIFPSGPLYTHRQSIAVNMTRSIRQRYFDAVCEPAVVVSGTLDLPEFGIEDLDFRARVTFAEFDKGPVVRSMTPVVMRAGNRLLRNADGSLAGADPIMVNVPAPIVNVHIDDGGTVSHQDVRFIRDGRGQLTGATVDGTDQPAA